MEISFQRMIQIYVNVKIKLPLYVHKMLAKGERSLPIFSFTFLVPKVSFFVVSQARRTMLMHEAAVNNHDESEGGVIRCFVDVFCQF